MKETSDTQSRMISHLVPWFRSKMPDAKGLAIENIQKPGMGLSNETYLFDLSWEEGGARRSRGMVLRSAPSDHRVFPDYRLGDQFHVMKAMKRAQVPVPEMLWLEEDESVLGSQFYIMERLHGTMPKDYPSYHSSGMLHDVPKGERERIWWDTLSMLAAVHRADWRELGLEFLGAPGGGADPVRRQMGYWERYLAWIKDDPDEGHPVLEAGLRWLKEHAYEPGRVRLCWGDARLGNCLYREGDHRILAVLDWEMAFLGDPEADLAWFIFIDRYLAEEYRIPRLEGLPGPAETVGRYEEMTGWKVVHYEYNEVFAAVRFGMILVSVVKKLMRMGMHDYGFMLTNNFCTRYLAGFLGMPEPGGMSTADTAAPQAGGVRIQFLFTGPGGRERYLLEEGGSVTLHEGVIDSPACTVRATAEDWRALQEGTLSQLDAWSSGRLVIDGDLNVMIRMKDEIGRLQP